MTTTRREVDKFQHGARWVNPTRCEGSASLCCFEHPGVARRNRLAIVVTTRKVMTDGQSTRSLYGLLSAIARSGECIDCWAIETKLRTYGFSAADARAALSDADDRKALLALCIEARTTAREQERMRYEASFRQGAEQR